MNRKNKVVIAIYKICGIGLITCGIIEMCNKNHVDPLSYGFTLCTFGFCVLVDRLEANSE